MTRQDQLEPGAAIPYFCATCGAQFSPSASPPARCPVCEDARQYVPRSGQRWVTPSALRRDHRNAFQYEGPGLLGVGTVPSFAIGQRALLVRAAHGAHGNVLWDCISLIDDATRDLVGGLGGLAAIAISHPHYYSGMVEWSRALGDVPVYLHEDDREWVMRPDPAVQFWSGETLALAEGLTLVRCGGHFPGGTVLHWSAGADGRGVLLSGDILQVTEDERHVSFMYSYPNLIPLPASRVERIAAALEPFAFEQIYGAWWGRVVRADGKRALEESARRYVNAVRGEEPA
jgi:glyoxylase-like metal-dependent hydrolase (beta-lactamase superfamily II)/DNA-directed RNA polymerase subunit RPC12/RpoP